MTVEGLDIRSNYSTGSTIPFFSVIVTILLWVSFRRVFLDDHHSVYSVVRR